MDFMSFIKRFILIVVFLITIYNLYRVLFSKPSTSQSLTQPIVVVSTGSGSEEEIQAALIKALTKLNQQQTQEQDSTLIAKLDRIAQALSQSVSFIR